MKQGIFYGLTSLGAQEAQAYYPKYMDYSWNEADFLSVAWNDEEEKKISH